MEEIKIIQNFPDNNKNTENKKIGTERMDAKQNGNYLRYNPLIDNISSNDPALNNINSKNISEYYLHKYFSTVFNQNKLLKIILLIFIPIIIIIEIFYRKPLFDATIPFEEKLQKSLSKNYINFFRIISKLGGGVLIVVGILLIVLSSSIIQYTLLFFGLLFSIYLHCVLKGLYREERPYWINNKLFQGECQTGFGNPSGHSFNSFYFYMTFSDLIVINLIRKKFHYFIEYLIYLIFFIWCALIAFSRLVMGVHSINQILYGSSFGFMIFITFSYIFRIYEMPLIYYIKYFKKKKFIKIFHLIFILLIIISVVSYYTLDNNVNIERYNTMIHNLCPKVKKYKILNVDSLHGSLVIIILFGIYSGQCVYWHLITKKNYIELKKAEDIEKIDKIYNKKNIFFIKRIFKNWIVFLKIICLLFLVLCPLVLNFAISSKNNLYIILVFKFSFSYYFTGFLSFGFCLYKFRKLLFVEEKDSIELR